MTDFDPHDRSGTDRFIEWDAAYVIGALSPAERHEFEEHIRECARCAEGVADLAGMPALLGAVPADEALAMLEEPGGGDDTPGPASADRLIGLTAQVRRRHRIRAWTTGLVGVAAAVAIAAGAIMVPSWMNPATQPTVSAPLKQVIPGPLTANVELTSATWGTTIEMSCEYHAGPSWNDTTRPSSSTRYGLYVTDDAGTETRVSSWSAGPGDTVHTSGSIDVPVSGIRRLDVRSLDAGTVLLSRDAGSFAGGDPSEPGPTA